MRACAFVGTRPEIIKMAPLIRKAKRRGDLEISFVHTGQHYDWDMSKRFLRELDLPDPDAFLEVGSATHAVQTARVMERSEAYLAKEGPDLIFVEGDTNSALGAALAAAKLKIPVGHVEAGCRSFDPSMPEEINRTIITDCASLNFAPTRDAFLNLLREGIPLYKVWLTGHPIVELVEEMKPRIGESDVLKRLGLREGDYALLTVHREENVEDRARLEGILRAASEIGRAVVFPVHPRTRRSIERFGLRSLLNGLLWTDPLPYIDTLALVKHSRFVMTDSGGLQQESFLLGAPCITLRKSTEWVETVRCGANFLTGPEPRRILDAVRRIEEDLESMKGRMSGIRPYGDGDASDRIIEIAMEWFASPKAHPISDQLSFGLPALKLIRVEGEIPPFAGLLFDLEGRPLLPSDIEEGLEAFSVIHAPELALRDWTKPQ
ncbi:MAG: UDP-N-acetylglucosamine 2-epimerase (non-hydrolyzing) [Candidatus Bathyarchaeia archaeon]